MRQVPDAPIDDRIVVTQPALGNLLRVELLSVPTYQRSYSWQIEQLSDYWNDLSGSLSQGMTAYFMGTIVVTRDGTPIRLNVVDGQQRLATTSILLAAIRDAYLSGNDESRANNVEMSYLSGRDLETDDMQPHLLLNAEDNAYFTRFILPRDSEKDPIPSTRLSHKRMLEAAEFFRDRVAETVSASGNDWRNALFRWVRFLSNDVIVILVEVADESSAFTIFEILNDRGLDLTIADLVKNYLFSIAGAANLPNVMNSWTSSVATLDTTGDSRIFTSFLRHYWSSRHGVARERQLFKDMRQLINSSTLAVRFVSELHEAAQLYAALLNSDHDFWAPHGTEVRYQIETLIRFGLEQNRPMLLAAMQHFTQAELTRLIKAAVAWSVRGQISGGIGGGTTEKAYSDAGKSVRNGTHKNADDVYKSLISIIPSDREFETSFSSMIENRAKYDRYYLQELEIFERKQREPEFVPNRDEAQVNLEHVFPKNSDFNDWPAFQSVENEDWLWRLGNLVLLSRTPNQRLGNRPFLQKKPVLTRSDFLLTQEVASESDWSPQAIERRQARLATLAVRVWSREP